MDTFGENWRIRHFGKSGGKLENVRLAENRAESAFLEKSQKVPESDFLKNCGCRWIFQKALSWRFLEKPAFPVNSLSFGVLPDLAQKGGTGGFHVIAGFRRF